MLATMKSGPSRFLVVAAAFAVLATAQAQRIFSCGGKKSDRPFVDCPDDQKELNPDGSPKRIVPRPLTEAEKEIFETRKRETEALESERRRNERADRDLRNRFPDETKHNAARKEALDAVRTAIRSADLRLERLVVERKPLLDEAEFYQGRPLPEKLKRAIDSNDALVEGTRASRQRQQEELQRISARYDEELTKLKKLWRAGP